MTGDTEVSRRHIESVTNEIWEASNRRGRQYSSQKDTGLVSLSVAELFEAAEIGRSMLKDW
jgi:hypothetical protein